MFAIHIQTILSVGIHTLAHDIYHITCALPVPGLP
jgi:hypothetical protein